MYMLLNILRSKDNQAMKIVQLIEYNLRNIFAKYVEEATISDKINGTNTEIP